MTGIDFFKMGLGRLGVVSAALVAALSLEAKFIVSQNHANALYTAGEEAVFTVTAVDDATDKPLAAGQVCWTLDNFGSEKLGAGTADLAAGNPFTVKGTLKTDGFLRLTVSRGKESKVWGVGYDVEKIRQNEPRPVDFDAYWAAEKVRIRREVPLDAKMTRDEKLSNKAFEVYRVNFATFNQGRVYGFLSVPADKTGAPFAFNVTVPGAGPGYVSAPGSAKTVTLAMNVHQFEPEATAEAQRKHMNEANAALAAKFGLPNTGAYCALAGIAESREAYHYHDVLLGIDRAVDWAVARDDVDKTRVGYNGSSQGGLFGLYLAYLNPHITRAFVAVCAGTGHYAFRQNRRNGWPQLIDGQPPAKRAVAERNAAYFDGVNFAAGIKIPMRVVVGFADMTCPPHDVYAAYNVIPVADKEITNVIGSPHSWTSVPEGKAAGVRYKEWILSK